MERTEIKKMVERESNERTNQKNVLSRYCNSWFNWTFLTSCTWISKGQVRTLHGTPNVRMIWRRSKNRLRKRSKKKYRYGLAPLTVNIFTPPRKWPAAADPTRVGGRRPQSPAVDFREKRGNRTLCKKRKRVQGGGYCECCGVHYSDLNVHCESKKHRNFVADEGNYQELDVFCTIFREMSRKQGTGIYKYIRKNVGARKENSAVLQEEDVILEKTQQNQSKKKKKRSILQRLSGDPKSRYMPNEVGAGRSRRSTRSCRLK